MGPKLNPGTPSTDHPETQALHHDGGGSHHSDSRRSLTIALTLTFAYMLSEVIGGLAAHSLALIVDAGHMVADSVAIGLTPLAMWIAARTVSITRIFGFQRTKMVAALLHTLSLWLTTTWILLRPTADLLSPPEVQGLLILEMGVGGLVINLAVTWIPHRSVKESLNVEGAPARARLPARLNSRGDRQHVDRRLWLVHSQLNLQCQHRGADGRHANAPRPVPPMSTLGTIGGYHRRA